MQETRLKSDKLASQSENAVIPARERQAPAGDGVGAILRARKVLLIRETAHGSSGNSCPDDNQ